LIAGCDGRSRHDVTVVGGGVVGLVSALRLAEAGHRVRVVAAATGTGTTSAVAAALWYPYRAAPQDKVTRWSAETFRELSRLTAEPGSGVRMRWGRELFRVPTADPWWVSAVPTWQRLDSVPPGYADGLRLPVPVVDMPRHLAWLAAALATRGVGVERRSLTTIPDDGDVVVNCAGLGARSLVPDASVRALRGQVVVVRQFGLSEWLLDQSDEVNLTYVVPRERSVVLGGTAEEDSEDLTPDPGTAAAIVRRCAALVPEAARARVIAHRVGLRPVRPTVRLELERRARPVVHCYGHGGAGVTLSYGCARDVVRLVDSLA
jgi:D-amino-acid oxidase